jgi:cation diffusion facilitator CzcD-associated flavoprotein CzcO
MAGIGTSLRSVGPLELVERMSDVASPVILRQPARLLIGVSSKTSGKMTKPVDVAIIGAGPYGLSIGAHLRKLGIAFRIFGSPMHSWRERMPAGMMLKSEGFASNLYDPSGDFTLKRFSVEQHLPYAHVGFPIPISTLISYGLAFQRQVIPELEDKTVDELHQSGCGFAMRLADGETVTARHVVIATGLMYFHCVPPGLARLPSAHVSHSSAHRDLQRFKGQDVTVIGAGSSALDTAALLCDHGAHVRIVARAGRIQFNPQVQANRPLWQQIRYPMSGIGCGLRARFYADAPVLFHYLPEGTRARIVRTFLGPAGGFYIRDRVIGRVSLMLGSRLERALDNGGQVKLYLTDGDGCARELTTNHVIAATGYKADVQRLPFLSEKLRSQLRSAGGSPVLSAHFESSVPNLYFVGLASANSFGPVMRFMFGAGSTARRLSHHLSRAVAL